MAHKRLHVFPDRCTGCRACEVACVAAHEGVFGRTAARIKVVKNEPMGLDYPNVCRGCTRPPCVEACPVEALRKDQADGNSPTTGAVILSEEKCIGCGACVEACPFGAADLHPQSELALICDLCGGDPACVTRCATGAIVYGEGGLQARQRREEGARRAYAPILARWGMDRSGVDFGEFSRTDGARRPEGPHSEAQLEGGSDPPVGRRGGQGSAKRERTMDDDKVSMEQMTWREIEEAIVGGKTTVILAVASIEQHGPHLPTGTDTYLGYALAEGIAHELGNALVAPVMRPGLSEHHLDFPGTVTLTQETFVRVLEEHCLALARHGFQDIALISSHGGNSDTMVAFLPRIAKALRERCQVSMVIPNIREQPGRTEEIYREYGVTRPQAGVHSGFAETSMMLALHPELVHMDRAEEGRADEAFYHPDRIKFSQLESFVHGVRSQSPNGILGDARGAQAEAGRRLLEIRIKQAAEEIQRMISAARERTGGGQ